jgi:hypothetical protein
MRRVTLLEIAGIAALAPMVLAQSTGPYKVIKTARVGGEGGTDYIYADTVGRRLYITRGATQAREATATTPAVPASEKRLTIFDLDTLEPVGVIPGVGGNGATVCPRTGHGFTSDHPQPSMFDVKTMKLIKTIEVPQRFSADGIYCDTTNDRVVHRQPSDEEPAGGRRRRRGRAPARGPWWHARANDRRRQGHHLPGPPGAAGQRRGG